MMLFVHFPRSQSSPPLLTPSSPFDSLPSLLLRLLRFSNVHSRFHQNSVNPAFCIPMQRHHRSSALDRASHIPHGRIISPELWRSLWIHSQISPIPLLDIVSHRNFINVRLKFMNVTWTYNLSGTLGLSLSSFAVVFEVMFSLVVVLVSGRFFPFKPFRTSALYYFPAHWPNDLHN